MNARFLSVTTGRRWLLVLVTIAALVGALAMPAPTTTPSVRADPELMHLAGPQEGFGG